MEEMTIHEMQEKLKTGEVTAVSLVEGYMWRIAKYDRLGPVINAIIELNPDALEIAGTLDRERQSGRSRGPLHGIPILIKDNIDTHDRMQTTSGSLALEGSIAPRDAYIVSRLRDAGAVLLGKTNLSEWANFRGKPSVSGWSSRGGLTRNPYALDRTACGSSSGSAAAVAADFCAAAIGTETDGSITCPAQTNSVVGIKPTVGLWSRSGIIPISHSQDSAGPMTRCVADAAILLGALAGMDERDPATRNTNKHAVQDYSQFLDPNGLKGARIGIARKMAGTNQRILDNYEECIKVIKDAGAEIIDPADVPNFDKFGKTEVEVLLFEFKTDLNKYLGTLGPEAPVKTMEDVIRFNEQHADKMMPYFGQERMLAAVKKESLSSEKYRKALAKNHRLTRREGIDAVMKEHHLDAIIVPTGGPAWLIDLANGDAINWDMESTSPSAVAGYPHITVPAGYIFGLPVGLSFIAGAWQEPTLIKLAYAFEQAARVRKPPKFKASADFKT